MHTLFGPWAQPSTLVGGFLCLRVDHRTSLALMLPLSAQLLDSSLSASNVGRVR